MPGNQAVLPDRAGVCRHPVAIVGGGPIGASLALALGRAGVGVTVIEAQDFSDGERSDDDTRPIALSQGSRRILESLGLWQSLAAYATPIREIHISDRGHFGFARLRARDFPVDALGYVIEAGDLGRVLEAALQSLEQARLIRPAVVQEVDLDGDAACLGVTRSGDTPGSTKVDRHTVELLVVCDGGRSSLRTLLGVTARTRDYRQSAVAAMVRPRMSHAGVAYERFTKGGPLALLPMGGDRCGLIWSMVTAQAEGIVELDDDAFLAALARHFGTRLGGFVECGKRVHFPLSFITVGEVVGHRLAILGNAAHHLHPVAGQGLNLGLRDVAALAEIVVQCLRDGGDPGDASVLARYARWRRHDQKLVARATDALVRVFSTSFGPLTLARDVGLLAFDLLPVAKRRFGRHAMGLAGRHSRLARGLPL